MTTIEDFRRKTPLATFSRLCLDVVDQVKREFSNQSVCLVINRTGHKQLLHEALFARLSPVSHYFVLAERGYIGMLRGIELYSDVYLAAGREFIQYTVAVHYKPLEE